MYITVFKSGKNGINKYVKLVENVRNANGVVVKRVIKNFGRLDDLIRDDPEALDKLKAKYSEENAQKKAAVVQARIQEATDALMPLTEQDASGDAAFQTLSYGHYPLRQIWINDLLLSRKIRYLAKVDKSTFDVDAALQYLIFHKIMKPQSILSTFRDKDQFLGDPVKNLSLDHFYEAYDFIAKNHDKIFGWINAVLDKQYGKSRSSLVFYDVTNAYFESPMTDEEKEYTRSDFPEIVQQKAQDWLSEGKLANDSFDQDGYVLADTLPTEFWDELSDDKQVYFRMRGPSKEHRFDLPLVSIALVIDQNGFPMDVCVYAGNSSEFKTMKSSVAALKKKYAVDQTIVVADRGLNSLSNLSMLNESKMGFLMAQKITQFNRELQAKMLDRTLYTPFNVDNPEAGGYQVIPDWKKTGLGGNVIDCTLVLTYDEKRKKRDEAILNMMVEIVKNKQKAGVKIKPRNTGWAVLAKTEGDAEQPILGVDEEELNRRRQLCGYAALVYKSAPQDDSGNDVNEPPLSGEQIASTYRQLNHIETCFRIMKSHLGLRPMYVRLAEHIKAHVSICTLALLMTRIIQDRLEKNRTNLSAARISESLREMKVLVMKQPNQSLCFLSIAEKLDFRRGREKMQTADVLTLLKEGQLSDSARKSIMQACGLSLIPKMTTRKELATSLKTKFTDDESAIPELVMATL